MGMATIQSKLGHLISLDQDFRPLPLLLSKNEMADTLDCLKKELTFSVYIITVMSGLEPCLNLMVQLASPLEGWRASRTQSFSSFHRSAILVRSTVLSQDSGFSYCNAMRIGIISRPDFKGRKAFPITDPKALRGSSAFMA